MEVLVLYSLIEPLREHLTTLAEAAVVAASSSKRMVFAIPYIAAGRRDARFRLVAATLDSLEADHLIMVDPIVHGLTDFRTPVVGLSAYPAIARWFRKSSRRMRELAVIVTPRLSNRGEAYAELLNAELLVLGESDLKDGIERAKGRGYTVVLLWDQARSCEELDELGSFGADYMALPHVACQRKIGGKTRIIGSDTIDNPYARVTVADILGNTIIAV